MARTRATKDTPLTPKQAAFIERYLVHFNATKAAIEAGYSTKSARNTASELLDHPTVIDALTKRRMQVQQEATVDRERIIRELSRIAFADIRKLYSKQGALLPPQEWPDDIAAAVGSLDIVELKNGEGVPFGETKRLKMLDKLSAIDKLMRYLGMFEVDNKQSGETVVESFRALMQGAAVVRPVASAALPDDGDNWG